MLIVQPQMILIEIIIPPALLLSFKRRAIIIIKD